MRLPHRLQGQKVKSQGHGAGAYCGGHLAAQLVRRRLGPFSSVFRRLDSNVITIIIFIIFFFFFFFVVVPLLVVVAVVVVVNMSTRSTPHVVALPSVDGRRGCRVICWQTRAVQGGPEKTFLGADDDLAWTDAVNTLAHTRRRFCSTINTTTRPSQAKPPAACLTAPSVTSIDLIKHIQFRLDLKTISEGRSLRIVLRQWVADGIIIIIFIIIIIITDVGTLACEGRRRIKQGWQQDVVNKRRRSSRCCSARTASTPNLPQ